VKSSSIAIVLGCYLLVTSLLNWPYVTIGLVLPFFLASRLLLLSSRRGDFFSQRVSAAQKREDRAAKIINEAANRSASALDNSDANFTRSKSGLYVPKLELEKSIGVASPANDIKGSGRLIKVFYDHWLALFSAGLALALTTVTWNRLVELFLWATGLLDGLLVTSDALFLGTEN
jgi:hypothetical protein